VDCRCAMFQTHGTCYHTGYKPKFSEPPAQVPIVPRAILRMQQWVVEHKEKHLEEDERKAKR